MLTKAVYLIKYAVKNSNIVKYYYIKYNFDVIK